MKTAAKSKNKDLIFDGAFLILSNSTEKKCLKVSLIHKSVDTTIFRKFLLDIYKHKKGLWSILF